MASGYITRFPFNSTTSTDSVGTYTLTGTSSPAIATDATYGSVLSLSGTSYLTTTANYTSISGAAARTYSYWIKPTATSAYYTFSHGSGGTSSTSGSTGLWRLGGASGAVTYATSTSVTNTNVAGAANTWYHCVITVSSAGAVTLFVNGGSAATGTVTQDTASANVLYIGRVNNATTNRFAGYMSDFRVYDSELSSTVVAAIYTSGPNDFNMTVTGTTSSETSAGSDGSIDITVANATGTVTYEWSNGATTQNLSGLSTGNYTVTATSEIGTAVTRLFTVYSDATSSYVARYTFLTSTTTDYTGTYGLSTSGSPTIVTTDATYGSVLNMPGGAYLTCGSSMTAVTGTAPRTFSFWAKVSVTGSLKYAMSYGPTSTGTDGTFLWMSLPQSSTNFSRASSGTTVVDYTANIGSSAWYFMVYTYTGGSTGTMSTYRDATLRNSGTFAQNTSSSNRLYIAKRSDQSANLLVGNMSDFRVYSVPLSAAAITNLYAYGPNDYNMTVTASASGAVVTTTVSNGTSPFTYSWSSGETTSSITASTSGTYTVSVTSAIGKVVTDEIDVTVASTDIVLSYTSTDVSVYGASTGAIDLTATGGTGTFSYAWSDGSTTTQDRSSLAAGSYTVTVTSGSSTASQTIAIRQPLSLSYTRTNVSVYGASTGAIDLTVAGGTGSYSYAWSDGSTTTQDRSSLAAGSYTVTVTSGSYTGTQSVTITQPLGLSYTSTDASVYGASDGAIDLTVSGGTGPYSYVWSDGSITTQDRSSLAAGSYDVTVTDAVDNTGTTTCVVDQPYAIQLISMPVAVKASWPAVVGATTYKFTYQTGASSEVVAATGRTALDLVVSDLVASTAYTMRVYSATTGAYVLAYSRPFTTPAATSNNFDKTMIATVIGGDTVYNLRALSSTSLSAVAPVVATILNTGDSVDIDAVHGIEFRPIRATVAKLNDTLVAPYITASFDLPLSSYKGVYLPFTPEGGDGQETSLTVSGDVDLDITYDEEADSIQIDGHTRNVGDIFILDGKKCVVMSVT